MKLQQVAGKVVSQTKFEWKSKVLDGLAPALFLSLMTLVLILLEKPVLYAFENKAGLMLFVIGILAASILCLERSLLSRYSDVTKSLYGLVGGALCWKVIELTGKLGVETPISPNAAIYFIMVALFVSILWRHQNLSQGAKLYSVVLLLSWGANILLAVLRFLALRVAILSQVVAVVSWAAVTVSILLVFWLFIKTSNRLQRLWCGMFIWYFISLAMNGLS